MSDIVIIGNSAAGLTALETFRLHDPISSITLISKEKGPAYSRVLLPYYLRRKIPFENLTIRNRDYYRRMKTSTVFGIPVEQVESAKREIHLADGTTINFNRLLIAAGARPVKPPVENIDGPGVYHLWTMQDATDIDPRFVPGKKVLVLGSGFVALQAAWAAKERGLTVTICELMDRIMPKVLDRKGAELLHRRIYRHETEIRTNTLTEGIDRLKDGSLMVFQKGYPPFKVDLIIVGTGVRPNTDFLEGVPIGMEGGIAVNDKMESTVPGIYAAGDIASGKSAFGETHVTHALWPTAVEHGKVAGANMAGSDVRYRGSLNMNVTGMFGTTVASMGLFSDDEGLVPFFPELEQKETYLKIQMKNNKPVGAVLLGEPEAVKTLGMLRPLIRRTGEFSGKDDIVRDLRENRPVFHRFIA